MKYALLLCLAMVGGGPAFAQQNCPPISEFAGEIIISGIVAGTVDLEWTVFETPDIDGYLLIRRPAAAQSSSSAPVSSAVIAELERAGDVAGERAYGLTDTAPVGEWVYELSVMYRGGSSCSVQSEPVTVLEYPSCGLTDVCNQVQESLYGTLVQGRVSIEWGSCAENESVHGYSVTRIEVGCRSRSCRRDLGTLRAAGPCGAIKLHSITDSAREGEYVYRIKVIGSDGRHACTFDTSMLRVPRRP